MNIESTNLIFSSNQKIRYLVVIGLGLILSANVVLDYIYTIFKNSSFYLSESLLFSSFWLLFLPLLQIQISLSYRLKKLSHTLAIIGLTIALHMVLYPVLIWIVSYSLYSHTFSFDQTFDYGLNTYLIKSVLIYSFSFAIITITKQLKNPVSDLVEHKTEKKSHLTSILVSDLNKKFLLDTKDILYFSANSPYITIHHQNKNYLHNETLKTLETQLDRDQFIRIHRSFIVNINKVDSYRSRNNGDYDLQLSNNTSLRLSRKYASVFKKKFVESHRLTTY